MSESTNPKKKEAEKDEEVRIGVYTCYCGGNISDVVNCEHVKTAMSKMPDVVVSRTDMSMCSDAGQALIEKDIKEKGINRVIVGACAPSLHEQTFRGTVARAGLNPYLYHHVGLREQDSWVSHDDCDGATCKALNLMMAGIAKTRLLKPLEPIRLEAEKHALVIGGGVAGLRTALDTARRGIRVTLIEKTPFLGGRMAQLSNIFPNDEDACTTLQTLIQKVVSHPKITIFTQAEVIGVSGYVGDYQIKILQQSRGISDDIAAKALAACEPSLSDEFNYGLTMRKVIFEGRKGCYPSTPAVDWNNYHGEEIRLNGKSVVFKNEPKEFDLKIGAIVVATGFTPYEPRVGEYGYKELPEVVTLPQLIRHLALDKTTHTLTWAGRAVNDIALIHCVGSREIEGVHEPQADGQVNNYCSRVCCTATLHMANELHERFPDTNIYDFYEDIRTYGRGHEIYYQKALEGMVRFLRFHGNERPEVVAAPAGDTHPVLVRAKDHLTWGEELEVPVDLVVLAVGMMPTKIDDLVQMLKISRSVDRFLAEVHPKLKPVETAVNGVILAGTAQGPMTIQESVAAASAAAVKVSVLLGQGEVQLDPFVAYVDPSKCDGTGACIEVCKYEDAIALETVNVNGKDVKRAVVTPANCAGCGGCVSACPNQAIDVQGWTLDQYDAMVDAIALDLWELMKEPA